MRRFLLPLVCVSFLLPAVVRAQVASPATPSSEDGTFRLHKFEQPIGQEHYSLQHAAGTLTLISTFEFSDRSRKVPLDTTFRGAADYTPQSFTIKGKNCRFCPIDAEVRVDGGEATIRQGANSRQASAPPQFFTISGYAPVAMQMALMRYWRAHGRPDELATLPAGTVKIHDRGAETFTIGSQSVKLERYNIQGLIWGFETLWMDSANNLVALVSTDAEFDHFEAVRDEDDSALAQFVASAARDGMAALTELSANFSDRQTGTLAFVGATVIDGIGRAIPDATIITSQGRIKAVGPRGVIKVPAGATKIDVTGKYIIPGLWDMHAHYEQVEWGPIYLAAGVTTVRDVGNEFDFITSVRDAVNSGKAIGPHMLLAGVVDGEGPMALGLARVNSTADAQAWVRRYHDANFQQIKIYSSMTSPSVKAVCAEAHKLGMTVTGHIPEGMTAIEGVEDGMDQINHINYIYQLFLPKDFSYDKASDEERKKVVEAIDVNSPGGQQIIQVFRQHGTVIDPTVALMEMFVKPDGRPFSDIEPGAAKVAPELRVQIDSGGIPEKDLPLAQLRLKKRLEIIGALHRAGVPIIAGTDQAVPGYSLYRELELYVDAGFTPLEALQAATIVPARAMRVDADSGSIEAGKRADLAILDANPVENIHNIRSVHSVVANGVYYQSAPLWQSVGFQP